MLVCVCDYSRDPVEWIVVLGTGYDVVWVLDSRDYASRVVVVRLNHLADGVGRSGGKARSGRSERKSQIRIAAVTELNCKLHA